MGVRATQRVFHMRSGWSRLAGWWGAAALLGAAVAAQTPQPPVSCRVTGRVLSGTVPLPGASIVVHVSDALKAATSTDVDGSYAIRFSPNATYRLAAQLTGFIAAERDLTLAAPPCDRTVDFQLALQPRTAVGVAAAAPAAPADPARA